MEGVHVRDLRRSLQRCILKLSLGVVIKEIQMFSRLLYRNKSQHRRDKSYQQLIRVSKDLKRYQSAALANCVKKMLKSLSGSLESVPPAARIQASEISSKLRDCAVYTARLIKFIELSFSDVHMRLSMSQFVAFNLVMAASLSRFWFCLRYHLLAIAETYDTVRHLIRDLKLPPPISYYLGKRYRSYLTKTPGAGKRHTLMKGIIAAEKPSATTEGQPLTDDVIPTLENVVQINQGNDVGVPVSLNEDQLMVRERDIALPPKYTTMKIQTQKNRKRPNAVVVYSRGVKLVVRSKNLMESCGSHKVLGARYTGRGKRYKLHLFPVQRTSLQRWLTLVRRRKRRTSLGRRKEQMTSLERRKQEVSLETRKRRNSLRRRKERKTSLKTRKRSASLEGREQSASLRQNSVRELQSWFTQELETALEEPGTQSMEDGFVGEREDMEGVTLREKMDCGSGCDDIDSIFNALQC